MDTYSAIADPTRRRILETLALRGEMTATDVCNNFSISPQAISQHLKVLRLSHLVQVERLAQKRMYSINPGPLLAVEDWAQQITQKWNKKFDRLEALLEIEKKKLQKKGGVR